MIRDLREWAKGYHEEGAYTPVGVAFHWIMAAVVVYQLYTGWTMHRQLVGADRIAAYQHHSEVGLALLLLGVLRLFWRMMVPSPANEARKKGGWRMKIASATHILFYVLFVILPVSGWAMWSAIYPAEPLSLAGLVPLPAMPFHHLSPEWQFTILERTKEVHAIAVIALSVLVPLHVGAALKHHFWEQNDVLEGMLPEVPDSQWHPGGPQYSQPGLPAQSPKGGG
jgi:cytochrome b561